MARLCAFGGLSLELPRGHLRGAAGQRHPLALLLLLAAAGDRGVSRDKLLAYLWPESSAERARNALRQMVYSLRRDLGAPDLFLGTTELRLNDQVLRSDLAEFDAALARGDLERAVALYAGPVADGFFLSGAAEFERWLDAERQLRARRFAEAVESLARAASRRGDHRRAVMLWYRLAAQQPLSGRVAVKLMEALADADDRAAALQYARAHETRLLEELGARPDEAVTELAARLRTRTSGPTPIGRTDEHSNVNPPHA
jgi:DNA-binding SARP family transcriptional activator